MATKYSFRQHEKQFTRFLDVMKSCKGDRTLVVLRGHLMIEEMLMVIIEREFKHAEALEAARLGFSQKLNMVKAIVKTKIDDHFDTVFTAINDLNEKLRNPLVHRLEHKDMEQRVDRFCEFVETRISPTTSTTREGTERLRFALAKLHTSTHVMIVAVSALRRRRPHSVSTPK